MGSRQQAFWFGRQQARETRDPQRRDPRPSQTQVAARRHSTPLILPGSGRCHQVGKIVGSVRTRANNKFGGLEKIFWLRSLFGLSKIDNQIKSGRTRSVRTSKRGEARASPVISPREAVQQRTQSSWPICLFIPLIRVSSDVVNGATSRVTGCSRKPAGPPGHLPRLNHRLEVTDLIFRDRDVQSQIDRHSSRMLDSLTIPWEVAGSFRRGDRRAKAAEAGESKSPAR